MLKVMIVDDDVLFARTLTRIASSAGLEASMVHSAEQALTAVDQEQPDLAFIDVGLPGMSGIELVDKLTHGERPVHCIMVSGQTTFQSAVDAMRAGALDFIPKASEAPEIQFRVKKAVEVLRMHHHLEYLQAAAPGLDQIIGESVSMKQVLRQIGEVAGTPTSTALILGETGTGKELVAKAIHKQSARRDKPFISVNCSAVPEQLVESEFFGHERGAFTGADRARHGLVELADQGSFFLDEIGEMDQKLQAKLLRLIEERSFKRVGGSRDLDVDVRFIAATNRDLPNLTAEGRFREDLLYRLNVFQIRLPPLRERGRDILLLTDHFIQVFNRELRKQVRGIDDDVEHALLEYAFPGNVRQLRNIIEQAMIRVRGDRLTLDLFAGLQEPGSAPARSNGNGSSAHAGHNGGADRDARWSDLERQQRGAAREMLKGALAQAGGNKSQAARTLGISRYALLRRLRQLEIQ